MLTVFIMRFTMALLHPCYTYKLPTSYEQSEFRLILNKQNIRQGRINPAHNFLWGVEGIFKLPSLYMCVLAHVLID